MNNKSKRGFLISLTGFDGVGKSTQVGLLQKYLKKRRKTVKTTEAMFSYFLLKPVVKVLRDATGSLPGGPVKRNRSLSPKLWFILAFIDIWIGFLFKILPLKRKYDFIIADRFYTDIWANLAYYGYLPNWAFSRFVRLLPKSDMAFILVAKPEVVLKREREFHPSYYKEQEKIYLQLAKEIDFNFVDAGQDPKSVSEEINRKIKIFL